MYAITVTYLVFNVHFNRRNCNEIYFMIKLWILWLPMQYYLGLQGKFFHFLMTYYKMLEEAWIEPRPAVQCIILTLVEDFILETML